ncbi:asparagine synthase-related protein [Alphaproteobacteria bacterium]|nr:asparagine synthase-related protein [Alphaproteobacteria bacterium]
MSIRGPDDVRSFTTKDELFVFARLAITDIHIRSMQPLRSEYFTHLSILFNGEIYNFKSIKKDLEKKGINFKTNSDTEVVVNAVGFYGLEKALSLFNGMFAFIIFNSKNNDIIGARDSMGQKPLYYYYQNQKFILSSDIKCISIASDSNVNQDFYNLYARASNEVGTRGLMPLNKTFFEKIYSVPAGSYFIKNADGFKIKKYFFIKNILNNRKVYTSEAEFSRTLTEEILSHSISDKQGLAVSFSGGVDSTLIALTLFKHGINFTPITKTTNGIEKIPQTIVPYIDKKLNLGTQYIEAKETNYIKDTISIIQNSSSPTRWGTAPSVMPIYNFCKMNGKSVILGGEGADEILFGYNHYKKLLCNTNEMSFISPFLEISTLEGANDETYKYYESVIKEIKNLKELMIDIFDMDLISREIHRAQDVGYFLSNISLLHLDVCSMNFGVEGRLPFMSKPVIKKAFSLNTIENFNIFDKEYHGKIYLKNILNQLCKELKLENLDFHNVKKEGTRNFAIQSAEKLNIEKVDSQIIDKINLPHEYLKNPKIKYRILVLSIFDMLHHKNYTREDCQKSIHDMLK